MQNFFSNLAPSQTESGPNDAPWWMKYASKGAGILAGIAAVFFGFSACITVSPLCIVAGIWQIIAGLFVITVEAPFCCMFLDFIQQFAGMVEGRPIWQKAAVYLCFSLPAIFLCLGLSTVVGSGALFANAVLHGLLSLGRKAPREEMASNATGGGSIPQSTSSNMKSGLVGNIQGQDVEAAKGNFS